MTMIQEKQPKYNASDYELLRFALVGCGRIGKRHAEHVPKVGQLVATCDLKTESAQELALPHQAAAFSDYAEMLTSVRGNAQIISVCTPNGLHAAHAIAALNAGFHVVCEKPMAITVHDCGEMIKAAERANRRLFVVKQNRYNPPVAYLKTLLDTGKLGKIYSAHLNCYWNRNAAYFQSDWKGTLELDGGTLFTQFSHFIDLLYWLVGDIRDVAAFTDNFAHQQSVAFEDAGVAILRFQNGALGSVNFTINSFERNMEGSLTLFCERGTVKIGGQYLNEVEYHQVKDIDLVELAPGRPANQYGEYQGSMSNHEDVYQNVYHVLNSGASIGTMGFEGLKTVEIIEKIYAATGRISSSHI